ncbi:MAG: helix-turn-helix domain-containing protein [Methylotenera sp.]|nr:helix-turn-helix domain-containing protein [Methylotenera sp.]MSQ00213.1 helix-turn-helix domain-containing protein [Methylotenera sp.]
MATKKLALNALDLMTTSDVAKELGVTIRSVQLWVDQGALDAWKTPGGHRRISRESFNKMIKVRTSSRKMAEDTTQLKVLVLENDEAMQTHYRKTIEAWDLPITLTLLRNSCQAFVDICLHRPDILVTELIMPDMDGLAMLRALCNAEAFSQMAIVAVTTMSPEEIRQKGGLPKRVCLYGKNPVPFWEMKELMRGLIESKNE